VVYIHDIRFDVLRTGRPISVVFMSDVLPLYSQPLSMVPMPWFIDGYTWFVWHQLVWTKVASQFQLRVSPKDYYRTSNGVSTFPL
jgi:hypothetical protein